VAAIDLRKVRKTFGKVDVIHGVDLSFRDGEFAVLVGPSGCGKSTLLRMIAGLESVTGGEIDIGGSVVNDLPPRDRDIAMVFQDYALYPHKTVAENMGFGLKMRGSPPSDIQARVKEAADVLQIGHLLDRRPGQLSGGQRQRVAMGRAIVRRPKVFLFDEPLSNLDAQLRGEVRVEIKKLHQRYGTTIVYVTHDQVEAMTLADRIAVLRGGHLEQFASPDDIYNRPASRFVAGFMGSPPMNFAKGVVAADGRSIRITDGLSLPTKSPMPAGAACEAGFRPEHVKLGASGAVTAKAHVEILEPLGAETLALLRVGGSTLTGRFPPQAGVKAGDDITITLETQHMQLFDAKTGQVLAA
jgi:multiple sugar transport system ATP-binding protein